MKKPASELENEQEKWPEISFKLHKLQSHIKVAHLPGLIHARDHGLLCHALRRPMRIGWIPGHTDLRGQLRHGTDTAKVPVAIGPVDQNLISWTSG